MVQKRDDVKRLTYTYIRLIILLILLNQPEMSRATCNHVRIEGIPNELSLIMEVIYKLRMVGWLAVYYYGYIQDY